MAKKDAIPPFEIMRRPPAGAAGDPTPPPLSPSADTDRTGSVDRGGPSPGGAPWWVGSSAPIVLRVPRGLAVVICLALLGLIVLAYYVGYAKGNGDLAAKINQAVEDELVLAGRGLPPPEVRGGTDILGRDTQGADGAREGDRAAAGSEDPRTAGLNYMVLATLPPDDALPLVRFLREHGVETILVSVTVRGSEQVQVVAVNKGFAGADPDYRLGVRVVTEQAW
ncbi:MAG: hypothetical protein GVY24_02730, partial [Planctomycetes bacterium]|nr:hypothetical protein [Planctomycetota bacterium]